MELPDSIPDLSLAISMFAMNHGLAVPEVTRTHLSAAMSQVSCVPKFSQACEALYAGLPAIADGDAAEAAAVLTGQLANFVATNFGTLSDDNRGLKIYAAMRRRVGETTTPDPSEDPAPLEHLVPTD